jgi:hypothetical protein
LQQTQTRADVFSDGLAEKFPKSHQGWSVKLVPLAEDSVNSLRPAMLALLAAIGCVLFIACSNVANLFLVQFASRSQELTMRYALGASRARVLRPRLRHRSSGISDQPSPAVPASRGFLCRSTASKWTGLSPYSPLRSLCLRVL